MRVRSSSLLIYGSNLSDIGQKLRIALQLNSFKPTLQRTHVPKSSFNSSSMLISNAVLC